MRRPTLLRHGSRVDIYSTDGIVSVLYGASVKEDRTILPPSTTGLAIETGEGRWHRRPEEEIQYYRTSLINRQLRRLLGQVEDRKLPVYLLDPIWRKTRRRWLADVAITFGEMVAGTKLLNSIKTTTDDVSKTIRGTLAGWLLSPIATTTGRGVSAVTGLGHSITAPLHKLSHRLHPEQFLLTATLRNLVIAEKIHYLLSQPEKPQHIALAIGGAHTGIEDHIQNYSSADRIKSLTRYKLFLSGVIPETFSQILRCDYRENKWERTGVYEVASLQTLLSS